MTAAPDRGAVTPRLPAVPATTLVAARNDAPLAANPVFRMRRPATFREVLLAHLPLAALTGAVLAAVAVVNPARVPFRTCMFLNLTGHSCPFCGFTRGFHSVATGDLATVLHACPAALPAYAAAALVFAWHAAAILCRVRLERGAWLRPRRSLRLGLLAVVAAALLANWLYRLSAGLT